MRVLAISFLGLLLGWIMPNAKTTTPPPKDDAAYLVALREGFSMEEIIQSGSSSLRSMKHPAYERLVANEAYFLVHIPQPLARWSTWLREHPGVRVMQLDHEVDTRQTAPADPFWEEQWNLRRINIPAVWEQKKGIVPLSNSDKEQIVVGILEKNGFDLAHRDLREQVWENPFEVPDDNIDNDQNGYVDDRQGWNFYHGSATHPYDQHGTKVAGLLGARKDNDIGISGISSDISFIPMSGLHYEHQIVRAYLYLRDLRRQYNQTNGRKGAYVVATNASFGVNYGHPKDYPIWCEIFNKLGEVGILSVTSVMNAPEDIDRVSDIPTSCSSDFLITVTESNYDDDLPGDAAYGLHTVDLAAPGRGSFTTFPNNRYGAVSRGTSFAAPHVTGTIALLYQMMCTTYREEALANPRSIALRTKDWLLQGVDAQPGFRQKVYSEGRLNAAHSYQLMLESCPLNFDYAAGIKIERVFPNPFTQEIQVLVSVSTSQSITCQLLDMQGQQVFLQKYPIQGGRASRLLLQFDHLAAGVYNLAVTSANGIRTTHRLVKTAYN